MQPNRSGVLALLLGALMLWPIAAAQAAPKGDANQGSASLPPQCIAAGIKARPECDAFLKKSGGKSSQKPSSEGQPNKGPSGEKPLRAQGAIGADVKANTSSSANKANDQSTNVHLSADCVAAGLTTGAECKALHLSKGSNKPRSTSNDLAGGTPATTAGAGGSRKTDKLDQDCLKAGATTPAQCDALHAINSQKGKSGVSTPPKPALAGGPITAPREPITKLPAGVTKTQIEPLFDSAKQHKGTVPAAASVTLVATTPPKSDKAAQLAIKPLNPMKIDQEKGDRIDPKKGGTFIRQPSGVTIVNQTVVNNNIYVSNVKNYYGPWGQGFHGAPPVNPIGLGIGVVLQVGGQLMINSPGWDQYRIAYGNQDQTYYDSLPGGLYRETIVRPDGTKIVTLYDADGDILSRSRSTPDGREIVLADFNYSQDPDLAGWRDPGDDLPPLQLNVDINDYVLDADQASEADVLSFFGRPPIEPLQRLYSISEVERSARLRDMMPRLELGDLTFDTGAATISPDEVGALSNVASAMLSLLKQNPGETFLVEGHTDAVGSAASNLQLSDARAATVASILTGYYHIPPENLATQGYGAEFLKIQTSGPERLNRRVVIRRITPLIAAAQ